MAALEAWQFNGSHVYGPDPDRRLICQVLSDGGRLTSDRQLIVEAPNLLDILENLAIAVSMGWDTDDLLTLANEASKRARGEQ